MKTRNRIIMGVLCIFLVVCSEETALEDNGNPKTTTLKTLTAQVENGSLLNSKIDEVMAVVTLRRCWICSEITGTYRVATGNFNNGEFMIILPSYFEIQNWIESIFKLNTQNHKWNTVSFFLPEEDNEFIISDLNAKIFGIVYVIAYKSGVQVGKFSYENSIKNINGGMIFADREVNIIAYNIHAPITSANASYVNHNYSIFLKEGWNYIFEIPEKDGNITLTTASQGDMKWFFHEY